MKANQAAVAKKHKQHPAELTVTDIGSDEDRWFDAVITADVVDKQGERLDPHGFTLREYRDILKAPIIDTHSNVTIGRFDPKSLEFTKVKDPRSGELVNAIKGRGRINHAPKGYTEYPVWRQVWEHIKDHANMGKPAALSIGGDPDPEQGKKVVCKDGNCHIFVPKVYWHETSIVRDERGGANPLATVSNINAMAKGQLGHQSALLKFAIDTGPLRIVKSQLAKDVPDDPAEGLPPDDMVYRVPPPKPTRTEPGVGGVGINPITDPFIPHDPEPAPLPESADELPQVPMEPPSNLGRPAAGVPMVQARMDYGDMGPDAYALVRRLTPAKLREFQSENKSLRIVKANPVAREQDRQRGEGDRTFLQGVGEKLRGEAPSRDDPEAAALENEDIRRGRKTRQTPYRRPAPGGGQYINVGVPRPVNENIFGEPSEESDFASWSHGHDKSQFRLVKAANYDPYTGEEQPSKPKQSRKPKPAQPQEQTHSSSPPQVPQHLAREVAGYTRPPQVPEQYRVEAPDPSRFASDVFEHTKRLREEERERFRQEAGKRREERVAQGAPPEEEAPRIRGAPETRGLARAHKKYESLRVKLQRELDVREETRKLLDQAQSDPQTYLEAGVDEASVQAIRQQLDDAKAEFDEAEAAFRTVRDESNAYRAKRGLEPERLRHLRGTQWEYKSNFRIVKAFDLGEGAGVDDAGPVPDDSEWLLDDTESRPPAVEPFVREETSARKDAMASGTPGATQMRVEDGRLTKAAVESLLLSHLRKKKVPAPDIHEPAPPNVRKPKQEMQARQARSGMEQARYGRKLQEQSTAQEVHRAKLPQAQADPAYIERLQQWRKQPEAQRGEKPQPPGLPKIPEVGPPPEDEMARYRTRPPPVYEPAPRSVREEATGERARVGQDVTPGFEHEHAAYPQDPASNLGLAGVTGSPEDYARLAEAEREAPAERVGGPETRVVPAQRAGLRSAAQQQREPEILRPRKTSEQGHIIPGEERIRVPPEAMGPPVTSPAALREPGREELREAVERPRGEPEAPSEVREPGVLHPQEKPTGEREAPYRAFASPRVRTPEGEPFRYTETEQALEPRVYQPLGAPRADPDVKALGEQVREANLEGELVKVEEEARLAQARYRELVADPHATAASMRVAGQEMEAVVDRVRDQFASILGATAAGRKKRQAVEAYIDERLGKLVMGRPDRGEDKMPGVSGEERSLIRGGPVELPADIEVPAKPVILDRDENRGRHEENGFQVVSIEDPRAVEGLVSPLPPLETKGATRDDLVALARFVVSQGDAVQAVGNLDAAASALLAAGNEQLAQRANRAAGLLRLGKVGRAQSGAFAFATQRLSEKNQIRREAQRRAAEATQRAAQRGPVSVEETPILRKGPQGLVEGMALDKLLAKVGGTRFYGENMERGEPDHRVPELPGFDELMSDADKVRDWAESQNKDLKSSLLRASADKVESYFTGLIEKAKDHFLRDDGLKAQFELWVSLAKDKLDEAKQLEAALASLGPAARSKVEAVRSGKTPQKDERPKENPLQMEMERMKGAMQEFGLPSPDMEDQMEDWLHLPTSVAHFRLLLARLRADAHDTKVFKPILDELRRRLDAKDPDYFTRMASEDAAVAAQWAQEQAAAGQEVLGGPIEPYPWDPSLGPAEKSVTRIVKAVTRAAH